VESQVNLVDLVLMPLIAFIVGMLMVLLMRKIAARLQRRIGPPFFQPLYDIVKLHGKQTQISHGLIHEIGIVIITERIASTLPKLK
jgi:NADH-quinone oxidoreductase subunit H